MIMQIGYENTDNTLWSSILTQFTCYFMRPVIFIIHPKLEIPIYTLLYFRNVYIDEYKGCRNLGLHRLF